MTRFLWKTQAGKLSNTDDFETVKTPEIYFERKVKDINRILQNKLYISFVTDYFSSFSEFNVVHDHVYCKLLYYNRQSNKVAIQ